MTTVTRNLTAAVGSVMSTAEWGLRCLADITLTNSHIYAQTGIGDLVVGTITYQGVGNLGGVQQIRDSLDRFAPGVNLWLSACSSDLFSEAINETLFNKDVLLYRAIVQNGAVVNTPELWFRGKINEVNMHRGDPERGDYLEVQCRIRLKKEAKSTYYTHEDLWLTYSGDTGFDYHSQISGFKGTWGGFATGFMGGHFYEGNQAWQTGGRGGGSSPGPSRVPT